MAEKISVNFDNLSLTELCDFEEASGVTADEVLSSGKVPAKAIRALVWIAKRRDDPLFTLEQAGELSFDDVEFGSEEGSANPTQAARPSSPASPPSSVSTPRSPLATTGS